MTGGGWPGLGYQNTCAFLEREAHPWWMWTKSLAAVLLAADLRGIINPRNACVCVFKMLPWLGWRMSGCGGIRSNCMAAKSKEYGC